MLMVVMTPRETWTDQRLDELNEKVDRGFERVDTDIRELRGDVKGLSREMNARFDALNRNLLVGAIAIVVALIGSSATLAGIAVF